MGRLTRSLSALLREGRAPTPARCACRCQCHLVCGPAPQTDMVSRRRILSRSRDDLNLDSTYVMQEEEEDVWYQRDKLYKDHIQEVLDKWTQIDDEIWAKVIVLERNRRVAKAYARAPVLTVNGSDDGFDGFRIGLCGFDNPMRDAKTDEIKRHIGHGVKVKMDDQGNILVKRVSKSNVYVKSTAAGPGDETSIGNEILKMPGCALEMDKPVKLFDMKKFQQNVSRELRRAYPDRRRLECQCLSAVAFVKAESELLDCPIWVLIINVVAMDMLKSRLPPVKRAPLDIRNRPRIPVPDEDPYSVAGSGGSGGSGSSGASSGGAGGVVAAAREQLLQQREALLARGRADRPPKLPPRDPSYPQPQPHDIPKPDYDDVDEEVTQKSSFPNSRGGGKNKDGKKYDDPYYCGLRARVPNFAKAKEARGAKEGGGAAVGVARDGGGGALGQRYPAAAVAAAVAAPPPTVAAAFTYAPLPLHPHAAHPPHGGAPMWHARSFDSGMGPAPRPVRACCAVGRGGCRSVALGWPRSLAVGRGERDRPPAQEPARVAGAAGRGRGRGDAGAAAGAGVVRRAAGAGGAAPVARAGAVRRPAGGGGGEGGGGGARAGTDGPEKTRKPWTRPTTTSTAACPSPRAPTSHRRLAPCTSASGTEAAAAAAAAPAPPAAAAAPAGPAALLRAVRRAPPG